MNGAIGGKNHKLTSSTLTILSALVLSIFLTAEAAHADPNLRERLNVVLKPIVSPKTRNEILGRFVQVVEPYAKDTLDEGRYNQLVGGINAVETGSGLPTNTLLDLISKPGTATAGHPDGEAPAGGAADYSITQRSLEAMKSAATELQETLVPEMNKEVAELKDKEKIKDDPNQPYYGSPFGGLMAGNGGGMGSPDGSGGGSTGGGGSKGGGSGSNAASSFSMGDRGGNALDLARPPEESPINQNMNQASSTNLTPFDVAQVPGARPQLTADPTLPPMTSASSLLKGVQQRLQGDKTIPEATAGAYRGVAGFPMAGSGDEKGANLKGGPQKGESLGEPSVSEGGPLGDSRNNFSAKGPDFGVGAQGGDEGASDGGGNASGKDELAPNLRGQVLSAALDDETGRSWVFARRAGKIINRSCEFTNSLIRDFCLQLLKKKADVASAAP
ncbi:MAG: hypothetical protein HYR96_04645 [Deltaproteobacteria bacterium]|nr:hypothetical protein [Deltaproteobacteria bacterium]MBI3293517.1 hypothetical protein [Deltaproteobacteria bacterium]